MGPDGRWLRRRGRFLAASDGRGAMDDLLRQARQRPDGLPPDGQEAVDDHSSGDTEILVVNYSGGPDAPGIEAVAVRGPDDPFATIILRTWTG